MYMLGSTCSPCCGTDACAGGFSYSDPLDEGQWIPSGQWFNVPLAGQTTVTGTFNPAARGKVWIFYGSHSTSSPDGSATVAEREDYDNPCNWWSYMNTDPFQLTGTPIPGTGNWRRATSLPPSDATVFFRTKATWTGTKTLAAAYFMGTNMWGDLICTGLAHDSPGGVVFCNAGPQGGTTLTSGATFGPGTILANATINGDVSLRASSNTLSPNYVNGNLSTGANSTPSVSGTTVTGNVSVTYRGTYTNCIVGGDVVCYESPTFNSPDITGNVQLLYNGTFNGGIIGGTLTMAGGFVSGFTVGGLVTVNSGRFNSGTASSGIVANGGSVGTPTTTTTITTNGSAYIYGQSTNTASSINYLTATGGIVMNGSGYMYNVVVFGTCTFNGSTTVSMAGPGSGASTAEIFHGTCEFNDSSRVFGAYGVPKFYSTVTFNDTSLCGYSVYFGDFSPAIDGNVVMNGNSVMNNAVIWNTSGGGSIVFNGNSCTTKTYSTGVYCTPFTGAYKLKFGFQGITTCNTTAPAWTCAGPNTCGCG